VQKVRKRLVNFRVTDDEFELLRMACERHGARCLSSFARNMMLNTFQGRGDLADEFAVLDRRLCILEGSISRLVGALEPFHATGESFADRFAVVDRRLSHLEVSMPRLLDAVAGAGFDVNPSERKK
jgi:hypothetical protein